MSDNATNEDSVSKRPKRRVTQRTSVLYENTTEDKDLKRALLASLQDIKKSVQTNKSSTVCPNGKSGVQEKANKSQVLSKLKDNNSSQSDVGKPGQTLDTSLLSLAAHRRSRVSAQRKFAQSSGFTANSPVSTPIKTGFVASSNVVDLFPSQRPVTEDFLTFLCLRRSPILPPNLDFIRMENERKAIEDKTSEDNSENISIEDLEVNDKYTTCRLRTSVDRRGSSSSVVSKTASQSSRTSLQSSNRKKCETQRKESKHSDISTKCKTQSVAKENGVKKVGSESAQNCKQLSTKTSKSEENKTFDFMRQKYKQQRIDKKSISSIPSKSMSPLKKNDSKETARPQKSDSTGIQTRQKMRSMSLKSPIDSKEQKGVKSGPSARILRSHQSVVTQTVPEVARKDSQQKTNSNAKTYKSLNSSQIGIRPKKRKARPVVPLIDYYFDSEFESESEKKVIKKNDIDSKVDNKSKETEVVKTNNQKSINEIKKKTSKPMSTQTTEDSETRNKVSQKEANKSKTRITSTPSRRVTRSSRPLTTSSKPVVVVDSELERQIKEKIIAIEQKHKRLRRCPSNLSLHSSDSSDSSSSSESLPNSLSSSSSIDNTRLTRSLGHLKKIRDYQAKLKKEQIRKEATIKDNAKNKQKTSKQIANKKQIMSSNKKSDISAKKTKNSSNGKKVLAKRSEERVVTRRMRESVVSAMSDTDCDTEGQESEHYTRIGSELSATEDSMASILGDEDVAEDINSLLVNGSETDLHYGSAEHIQGLMTSEFSGAFSDETVATASAILLPSNGQLDYSYGPTDTDDTGVRMTVDASTNTTDDDLLSSLSDETQPDSPSDYSSNTLSVGTQTTANSGVQTDGTDPSLEC